MPDSSLIDKLKIWAFPLLLGGLNILLTRQINEAASEIKETRKDIIELSTTVKLETLERQYLTQRVTNLEAAKAEAAVTHKENVGAVETMAPLVVDGQLGPKTIAAINAINQAKLLKAFVQLRRDHYEYRTGVRVPAADVVALLKSLRVAPDPTQIIFLKSWLVRLPRR